RFVHRGGIRQSQRVDDRLANHRATWPGEHGVRRVLSADPVARNLGEPERLIGTNRNREWSSASREQRELAERAVRRYAADLVTVDLREPERAIGASGDANRIAVLR